jgi:uncharacterized protein
VVPLLDVNVLVALAWPNHVHHGAAHRWFADLENGWATTPITEAGFVRVSSNARILSFAVRPPDALEVLAQMVALPGHTFWADDVRTVLGGAVAPLRVVGHQQVTDAHLVALAISQDGVVASFDGGLRSLVDRRLASRIIQIPA